MARGDLQYQIGFGNELATEALPGALPVGQSNPRKPAYGLYTEEINGTPFTAPRGQSRRSWTYRIRPSVTHKPFRQIAAVQRQGAIVESVARLVPDCCIAFGGRSDIESPEANCGII